MKIRRNNGITLISLVVTIIVLFILAGVSISAITGESGIVKKAIQAKEDTSNANIKEKIQLASQMALSEGLGTLTRGGLSTELDKYFEDYDVAETSDAWVVTVDKVKVDVPKESNPGLNDWGFYFDEIYVATITESEETIKIGCIYHEDGSAETFVNNPSASGGYLICESNVYENSVNYNEMGAITISPDGLSMIDEEQGLELKCNFLYLHGAYFSEEYTRVEKIENDSGTIETEYSFILYENGIAQYTTTTINNGIASEPQVTTLQGLTLEANNYIIKNGNTIVAKVSSDGNAIMIEGELLIRE